MASQTQPFLGSTQKDRQSFSGDSVRSEDIEADFDALTAPKTHSWTTCRVFGILFRTLTVLLAFSGIVALIGSFTWSSALDVYHPSTLPPDANACDCGTTLETALARQCRYDSLASAWLPPSCRDDELTAQFEKAGTEPDGSWPYFADEEGTRKIDLQQVASLGPQGGVFWTTREWHLAHCMYYWRKLYRMRDTGVIMERRYDSEKHVDHCGRLAMKDKPKELFLVDVPVQMNSAVSLDSKKLPGMHHQLGGHSGGSIDGKNLSIT